MDVEWNVDNDLLGIRADVVFFFVGGGERIKCVNIKQMQRIYCGNGTHKTKRRERKCCGWGSLFVWFVTPTACSGLHSLFRVFHAIDNQKVLVFERVNVCVQELSR